MYPLETRELAVEAVAAGFSLTEAAELAGCSRTAVVNWAKAAGVAPPPRKKAVYLPFDRKMELVARLEAGERAADLAAEAGVTAAAVSGWRRRLREEGALSLMTDSDIAARAPEPREAPSELEELRARCEELELRNAVLEGTIDILKKDPGADLSALTAAERAALADRLRGRFGLRAALAALSLPRSTFYDRLAAASAPDPYAALRPLVRAAFEASGGAYGYRRVRAELARGAGAQSRDVLHAHLPRAHHAARAQLVPYARRLGVAHRGLGTHVQLDVRRVPLSQAQRAQVAHDERVDAGRGKRFEVRGKRLEVVGVHEGVQRHVRLRARIVHESCRSGNVVQREVRRALPQPEPIGGQVHGVRTEAQRGLQLRKPARGREELGSPCRLSSHAPYCSASANPRAGDHRNPSLRAGQRPYLAILRISEPCGTFPSLSHPIAFPSWT